MDFRKTFYLNLVQLRFKSFGLILSNVAALLLIGILLTSTLGCQIPYMTRSAYNHLVIMSKKEKISKLIKAKDFPENWRHKLKITLDIRPFISDIGLDVTDNYKSFVDLKRPYVSYLLTVAPQYSLEPKTWGFPFIGSFPYKGFHAKKQAQQAAKNYQKNNMDAYIRGVSAYSTLGWFNDPLLSSMLKYSDSDLIETVIHESVHATVFVKNNVSFNENLAVFVARKATLEYYKREKPKDYQALVQTYADEDLYLSFLQKSTRQLKDFYKSQTNHTQDKKQAFFAQLKKDFKNNIKPKFQLLAYPKFLKTDLNNAYFASQNVYFKGQHVFEEKYQSFENISEFIQFLKDNQKDLTSIFATTKASQ